jgi:hypothetical protein
MKPLKYTVAALALIATVSLAHAATDADLILGIYDTNTAQPSYELDLGTYTSLSAGETFNLGSTVSSTFAADSGATLQFDIAGSNSAANTQHTLSAHEIIYTALTAATGASTTTPANNVNTMYTAFNSGTAVTLPSTTSSNSTAISAVTVANGITGNFQTQIGLNGGEFGFGNGSLTDSFPTSDTLTLYTQTGAGAATAAGTFQFSTNGSGQEILTFDPTATPEPSAYALGLCAVALFLVLKRRSSVA